jgi:catechol 2,3-dioxygenase-like lactoylglutathione lyase family enzyme
MTEYLAPIMRVADANAAVAWYQQLGFVKEWEHRFEAGLPLYVGMARGDLRMHLSEHTGDARPGTLVYFYVEDVDAVAGTLGVTEIDDMPWGRDFEVSDLDGNRLRIGTAHVDSE